MTQGAWLVMLGAAVAVVAMVALLVWADRTQKDQVSREREKREEQERRRRWWARRLRGR
jgi:FtsZ-interacting cell division protein ZipA